uniref:Uncharacterized protein n=1 Tax=Latimeria chalumnae TaxID=7897 RepID=H3AC19_LATCH
LMFEPWSQKHAEEYPLFAFRNLAKRLTELNLLFTRSQGEELLTICSNSEGDCSIFFVCLFDHPNYARWLSVHIRDLDALSHQCPSVYTEFMQGKFVIFLTGIPFTGIPLDQANEFNIKKVKGRGGFGGIENNPQSLRRLMVTGPEFVRMISEFQNKIKPKAGKASGQYERDDFSEYVRKQFDDDTRQIDIIFDVYKPDSLENSTREKRGKTSYNNWQNFLHDSENKEQLFRLLAKIVIEEVQDCFLVVTIGESVLCSMPHENNFSLFYMKKLVEKP